MKKNPQKRFALLLVIVLAVAVGPEIVKNLNTVNKTTEEMVLTVTYKDKGRKKKPITSGKHRGESTVENVYYIAFDTRDTADDNGVERTEVGEATWNNINEGDRLNCKVTTRTYRNGKKSVSVSTDGTKAE